MKQYQNLETFIQAVENCLDLYLTCCSKAHLSKKGLSNTQLQLCLINNEKYLNKTKNTLVNQIITNNFKKERDKYILMLDLLKILNKTELTIDDFQFIMYNPSEIYDAYVNGGVYEQYKNEPNLNPIEI